jgi:hypothetical protein
MTNEEMSPAVALRFKDLDDKLVEISGQIGEMKREMVTRKEYNEAHGPLLRLVEKQAPLVEKHERAYVGAVKGLIWLGVATLVSAIVSPHWSAIVHGLVEFFK